MTTATLADDMVLGPECMCGCGQHLPYGSLREYKNGHRKNAGNNQGGRPSNAGPAIADVRPDINDLTDDDANWLTLADAATEIPNDPDPAGQDEFRPAIRVTKRVKDDIEGKVGMLVMMTAMLWQTKDPICGKAFEDNGPNITAKFVPIICKSPEMVRWFTKGGNYTAWLDLIMALWPVATVMFSHHVSHATRADGKANLSAVPNEAYQL